MFDGITALDLSALVNSHWWMWYRGMRACDAHGVTYRVVLAGDAYEETGIGTWVNVTGRVDFMPDVNDYATFGCMYDIVSKAWRTDGPAFALFDKYYRVSVLHPFTLRYCDFYGATRGEALAAAIIGAPAPEATNG